MSHARSAMYFAILVANQWRAVGILELDLGNDGLHVLDHLL